MESFFSNREAILKHIVHLTKENLDKNVRSFTGKVSIKNRTFFIKTAEIDLEIERQALAIANNLGIINGVSSVKLVGYDPNLNILVTEYVKGDNLFNAIWNDTYFWKIWRLINSSWPELIANIANWLKSFHNVTATKSPCDFYLEDIQKSFDGKLGVLLDLDRTFLSKMDYLKLKNIFDSLLEKSVNDILNISLVHGDFIHSNILIADNHIFICDFADSHKGVFLEDIVRFWVGIWEISTISCLRRKILRPCLKIFLKEYGLSDSIINSPLFLALRIWNSIVRLLETVFAFNKNLLSSNTRRILLRLARSHIMWLQTLI